MKQSLAALATLAVTGVASAQSSVTLFGVVDAAVSGYSNETEDSLGNGVTTKSTKLSNSGYNASRLGFRGTEDLGGGLAAGFWLEAGINNDDGSGTTTGGGLQFNRRSTVSLSGSFGEVRLGRDYTPTYWNDTVFDPFGTNGVGSSLINTASGKSSPDGLAYGFRQNKNYSRASDSIGYFLPPTFGGLYGQFMYAMNEATKYDPGALTPDRPDTQRAGRYIGGRVGYAQGPLDIAIAYGSSTVGDDFFGGTTTSMETLNLGASYDFGAVKLFGEYSDNKSKTDRINPALTDIFGLSSPGVTGWLLGATVPVGPGLIRISYSAVSYKNLTPVAQVFGVNEPKADKMALGYVYNLSRRTALYGTAAYVSNKNGANLTVGGPDYFGAGVRGTSLTPKSSTGYDVGIRHAF